MKILFIRHGLSYANLLKEHDILYPINVIFDPDSKLTIEGIYQARSTAEKLSPFKIIPIIFSSTLSRAIQTASEIKEHSNLFNEIIVLPNIEEIPLVSFLSIDRQNHPRNIFKVMDDLQIQVNTIGTITPYDTHGNLVTRSNVKRFYNIVVPKLIEFLSKYKNYDTIVIVSHRKVIAQATGISVENCGIVLQDLSNMKSEVIFDGYAL